MQNHGKRWAQDLLNRRIIIAIAAIFEMLFFASYALIPPTRNVYSVRLFLFTFFSHSIFSAATISVAFRNNIAVSRRSIFAVFFISRILIFPMLPWLSDDVFGYLFYGRELINGVNPYSVTADSPSISYLRNDSYAQMAFQKYPAIYPPLSIYFFGLADSIGSIFSADWKSAFFGWKFILFAHEFAALVILLFSRLKRYVSVKYILAYLIMPLPVVEIIGQGHCDGLAVPYIALFILLLGSFFQYDSALKLPTNITAFLLGGTAGILAAVKLIPAVLFGNIFATRKSFFSMRNTLSATIGAIIFSLIFSLPLLHDKITAGNFLSVLNFYNNTYFNSTPLMFLRFVTELFSVPDWWLFAPKILSIIRGTILIILIFILRPSNFRDTIAAGTLILTAATVISPKVHAWYFAPVLFLTVLTRQRWIVVFAYSSAASYLMYGFTAQKELFVLEYCVWTAAMLYAAYDIRKNGVLSRLDVQYSDA